jgi:large subunit ribosomal protein L15
MELNTIKAEKGATQKRMRRGRGDGSGKGTFSGRGMNGQSARSGGRVRPGFSGGQTPLYMRMPKLPGFKNHGRVEYAPVNVGTLEENFKEGETVTKETLIEKRVLRNANKPVKILGNGTLKIALTVKVDKVSKAAEEKIVKAKGTVEAV